MGKNMNSNFILWTLIVVTMQCFRSEDNIEKEIIVEDKKGASVVEFSVTVSSLLNVFNGINDDGEYYYTEDKWVIHDSSRMVEIDGYLMIGITGKG